jgi:hypothetical protein
VRDTSLSSIDLPTTCQNVNLHSLKKYVKTYLPSNSPLSQLILSERDQIKANEFLIKMNIWLTLFDFDISTNAHGRERRSAGGKNSGARDLVTDSDRKVPEEVKYLHQMGGSNPTEPAVV